MEALRARVGELSKQLVVIEHFRHKKGLTVKYSALECTDAELEHLCGILEYASGEAEGLRERIDRLHQTSGIVVSQLQRASDENISLNSRAETIYARSMGLFD